MRLEAPIAIRSGVLALTFTFGLLCHADYATAANVSHLNWGKLSSWEGASADTLPPDIKRAVDVAGASLDMQVKPVEAFYLAGTLNQDPRHIQSDRAKATFSMFGSP